MTVYFADEQTVEVDGDDLLGLARHVLAEQQVPDDMEVSVLLVDEDAIAALNEQHMGKTGPTDVLAFPIDMPGEVSDGAPAILGDVVLCPAVSAAQAPDFGRSAHQEHRLLVAHGLLHLLGMDHATKEEEREMFSRTDELLASYVPGETAQPGVADE